jgi:hypothetical protein
LQNLNLPKDLRDNLSVVLSLFEQGTLFGSLIQVPETLAGKLKRLETWLEDTAKGPDLLASAAAEAAQAFLRVAQVLGRKYDVMVTNPPYLSEDAMDTSLKKYVGDEYAGGAGDLYGCFILRGMKLTSQAGFISMITIPNWMYLADFEELRIKMVADICIDSLILNGRGVWGSDFGSCSFVLMNWSNEEYTGVFKKLYENNGSVASNEDIQSRFFSTCAIFRKVSFFKEMPTNSISFWISEKMHQAFKTAVRLKDSAPSKQGIKTGNNDKFLRFWSEVDIKKTNIVDHAVGLRKWYACTKGGKYRKWYGNHEYVINWENNGKEIKGYTDPVSGKQLSRPQNIRFFFTKGITWSTLTISKISMRIFLDYFAFESKGSILVCPDDQLRDNLLCLLNSAVVDTLISALAPSVDYGEGVISRIPVIISNTLVEGFSCLWSTTKSDWDAFETSWDFKSLPWLPTTLPSYLKDITFPAPDQHSLESCWDSWRAIGQHWTAEMLRLEEENNRLFIDAYGLQDELTPEVPIEQITLTVNPWYRYKPRKSKAEASDDDGPGMPSSANAEHDNNFLEANDAQHRSGELGVAGTAAGPQIYTEGERRMRGDGTRELVSYALGCLMGRYSLDEGGLQYAEAGGQGFDGARYRSYPADDDGIVPVTDCLWFETDAALRVEAFIRTVWDDEQHEANMVWLAEGLGAKDNELPLDTLRRYLAGDFYKDHLQTYKKRPIYWKFSSGKEKAFEALVYLHRYHAGTLSRMRMQYVVPLTGQLRKKIDSLDAQVREAASTAERKRLEKEQATLQKKLAELAGFDEELNHYAQSQIALDLDDGVRVNYGKFGGLLANVKDVCGKVED